jgi:hypothetical protein
MEITLVLAKLGLTGTKTMFLMQQNQLALGLERLLLPYLPLHLRYLRQPSMVLRACV